MPRTQPTQSFQSLRNYMEKWTWTDAASGIRTVGYNPPEDAKDAQRMPFFCRWITGKGKVECGNVVCLKVDLRRHQRKIQFVESKQIRVIRDYLIIEVDGVRIITH